MIIDILTVDGSPKGVTPQDINGRGVGGAELALMELSEYLAKRGHKITIYNNPKARGLHRNVFYAHDYEFIPENRRDVLITFRGPNPLSIKSNKKRHIGFSTDQFTVGDYVNWYNECDKLICISPFHKLDHIVRYGKVANKASIIDLGINIEDYLTTVKKVPYKAIFCSVPDRGLNLLLDMWPKINALVPQLKLVITSDYTLWGAADPMNMQYRLRASQFSNIEFLGNVSRQELINHQLSSEVQLYPCTYDENFCIANAECQSAGCYTITSNVGALATTNMTKGKIDTNPFYPGFEQQFLDKIKEFFDQSIENRILIQEQIKKIALERFDWNIIIDKFERDILS